MHQRGVAVPVPQVDARAAIQQQLDLGQAGETGPTAYVKARCSLSGDEKCPGLCSSVYAFVVACAEGHRGDAG